MKVIGRIIIIIGVLTVVASLFKQQNIYIMIACINVYRGWWLMSLHKELCEGEGVLAKYGNEERLQLH